MPYFSWKGIDLEGRIHQGKLFSQSDCELDQLLFKQGIALVSCTPVKQVTFFGAISLQEKVQFFNQLADLLNSGVLLPNALLVVSSQAQNGQFRKLIDQITSEVHSGSSLSQVLTKHQKTFDLLMVEMVKVGEESSNLRLVLQMLADYLQMHSDFTKGLRSALLVPVITFIFFIAITVFIFVMVIPQFESMFQTVNQSLPPLTKTMIMISSFMRSPSLLFIIGAFVGGIFLIRQLLMTEKGKKVWDVFILNTPFVGPLVCMSSLGFFLHAVSMLLKGGVPLLQAIEVAKSTVRNSVLAQSINAIAQEVEAGSSFSQAMIYDMKQIFDAHVIAIVRVGEETGNLAPLLERAARSFQVKVSRKLALIVTMINPLLMIFLGVLVTFLIMAVYIPIFNLSNIV